MNNEINKYIYGLDYDPVQLLAIPGEKAVTSVPYTADTEGTSFVLCKHEPKKIGSELYDISLLSASDGIIYPGATVRVNRDFAEARPTPIPFARAPLTLSINLPGLEEEGKLSIAEPTNAAVQSKINHAIDYWLTNDKGYTVASKQQFLITDVYTSSQTALDLDLNVKWLSGELKNHLSVQSNSTKSCVIAMYKQIFYSISMEAPHTPSDLFHKDVTVANIQSLIDSKNPLGYVRSMDYGRMLFVKIESSNSNLKTDMHSILNATVKNVTVSADVKVKYEKIMKESTITVISLGGNASVAANVITSSDISELMKTIRSHAEFKKDNPGIALGYTTAFAKDNSVALISSSTNYVEKTYEIFTHTNLSLSHGGGYIAECLITYKKKTVDPATGQLTLSPTQSISSGKITAPYKHEWNLNGACTDIHVEAGEMDALVWHKWNGRRSWRQIFSKHLPQAPTIKIHIGGTTLSPSYTIE